jgi:tetratricopeptide (TPR) repeat protein
LPKGVVKNASPEEETAAEMSAEQPTAEASGTTFTDADGHEHERPGIQAADRQLLEQLKEMQAAAGKSENSAIFADSIAQVYAKTGWYDSAAWYAEQAQRIAPSAERTYQVGLLYFNAFNHTHEGKEQQMLAQKAQTYLQETLEQQPDRLEAKTKLALTYVASQTPMQGILMLQEVLEKDPKNQEALFNLGVLSVQTGQFDKAAGRLAQLVAVNPAHMQGQFYLAYSYLQLGQKDKARTHFEQVKKLDSDPEVQATVDEYLKELN